MMLGEVERHIHIWLSRRVFAAESRVRSGSFVESIRISLGQPTISSFARDAESD
jgi:hypothetical protein